MIPRNSPPLLIDPAGRARSGPAGGGTAGLPPLPAVVLGDVRHQRRTPIRHTVRMRTHLWLIDLDQPPTGRGVGRFLATDHFAGTEPTIRAGLQALAAAHGELIAPDDRLIMLAAPRQFGHVFNPLSVHWCLRADGSLRFAVLEIHNTYGQRHAHLIHLDERRAALVDKEFYVSPFFPVDGRYRVRLDLRPDRVTVSVVLEREGSVVFAAAFRGVPTPDRPSVRWLAAVRTPLSAYQTTARIKWHGIRLWARRLPIHPRPDHVPPRGMR